MDHRDVNCVTLIQEFAEVEFPKSGCNLEKWSVNVLKNKNTPPQLAAEVEELFSGKYDPLLATMQEMLSKTPAMRPDAQSALSNF